MGNNSAKVHPSFLPGLVKTLAEAYLPDDRNIVLNVMDQIDNLLVIKKTYEQSAAICKELGLFYILIRAVKKLTDDIEAVSIFIQILESIRFTTPLVMDFIQYGGLDLVEKIQRMHDKDDFLVVSIPKILKALMIVGGRASIEVIKQEGINLQLCQKCQEIIERQKHPFGFVAAKEKVSLPKSSDRINKVLRFMDNFLINVKVQLAGLDAMLHYVHNADAPNSVRSTDAVDVIVKIIRQHKTEGAVVWRAFSSLAMIASFASDVAVKIAATNIHEELIDQYKSFQSLPIVQLHFLRLYGSLLNWPKSYHMLHKSKIVMEFLKTIVESIDEARKRYEEQLREKERQALASKGVKGLLKAQQTSKASTLLSNVINEQQMLPLPFQIRKFLRDTGGKVYRDKSARKNKATAEQKERRNFDERPKFGTVEDRIYTAGEEGLVKGEGETDDPVEAQRLQWEKHLQYGETKQKQ